MNHTIDTKAILELAETSPEAKAYLEREFPELFKKEEPLRYYIIETSYGKALLYGNHCFTNVSEATTEEIQKFIPDYNPNN